MQTPEHWSRRLPEMGSLKRHARDIEATWAQISEAKKLIAQLKEQARKQEAAMMADIKQHWTLAEINDAMQGMSMAQMDALQSLGVLVDYGGER